MALSQLISLPNALSVSSLLTTEKGTFQRESYCASALNNEAIKAKLISALRYKGEEFKDVLKMGRTQLQDAVPMTAGQEFNAYANNLEEEILNIGRNIKLLHEINMGGTAIGTGLNAISGFAKLCAANLSKLTGEPFVSAIDLVEATPDTGAYVSFSGALKRLAVKLSKICNDFRLMASGPRCGLNEINLSPKAPGYRLCRVKSIPSSQKLLIKYALKSLETMPQ
jgi:aspartate ammonia-lyase